MITDDQMIEGWYGSIKPQNEEQEKFMLDTGHLFEMHSVEKIITDENVISEIRAKYPPSRLFDDNILTNNEMLKKFRAHISGMGIEPDPNENLPLNTRVPIKIAHVIYPGLEQKDARLCALDMFNKFIDSGTTQDVTSQPTAPEERQGDQIQPTQQQQAQSSPMEVTSTVDISGLQNSMQQLSNQLKLQQIEIFKQISELKINMEQTEKAQSIIQPSIQPRTTRIIKNNNLRMESNENINYSENPSEIKISTSNNRLHHDIAQRFKNKDEKYGGTDDEDLFEYLITYETTADDYEMSEEQKCKYIHNIFKEEALRHYNANVRPQSRCYKESKRLMLLHFNSPDVQVRVKNELQRIKFQSFIQKEGSKPKALSLIASYISNRSRKCPPAYSHETHRVEFLKKALMKEEWAKSILLEVNDTTQFQSLYTKLANALQFFEEADENTATSEPNHHGKPSIFFTQPKYGRKITGKLFSGAQYDKLCWNCDKPGHRHNDCRKKHDPVRIAAAKARFLEKKSRYRRPGMSTAKQVLYELAEELREIVGGEEHSDTENPADTFFGDASDNSSSESEESEKENSLTADELFNLSIDEQDF